MQLILAEPRGFCAGVRRAIEIVEKAIIKFGTPIYVKHEIVHNKYVVENLKAKGVIFTDDLSIVPDGATIIYSAHGVSEAIEIEAKNKNMLTIDATCPLVKKVHREVIKYADDGCEIILIGHRGHPEIEGTAGRVKNDVILVETTEDAKNIQPINPQKLALATQTTLSSDDTKEIVEILQKRFPILLENSKNDICYATQNRQDSVKCLINDYKIDILLTVGSANSSNSNRLKDIGTSFGIESYLVNDASDLQESWFMRAKTIGITAGASAPDELVDGIIEFFKAKFLGTTIEIMNGIKEDTVFHLPREVRK